MSDVPVHCIIESVPDGCCMKCANDDNGNLTNGNQKLLESYAIVAGHTPLSKLNDAVLTALGLTQFVPATSLAQSAVLPLENSRSVTTKGLIVIDNWKPLTFDQITDDVETPIGQLFKHISGNRWILKILVSQANAKMESLIVSRNGEIIRGDMSETLENGERDIRSGQNLGHNISDSGLNWYQLFPRYNPYVPDNNGAAANPNFAALVAANRLLLTNPDVAAAAIAAVTGQSPLTVQISPTPSWPEHERVQPAEEPQSPQSKSESLKSVSPKYGLAAQRKSVLVEPISNSGQVPRLSVPATCRLMFDPLTELSLLNEWFEINSHPTCHDIEKYTNVLNSKQYRRTYPPVLPHNVKIWFKNRRAKSKRSM